MLRDFGPDDQFKGGFPGMRPKNDRTIENIICPELDPEDWVGKKKDASDLAVGRHL